MQDLNLPTPVTIEVTTTLFTFPQPATSKKKRKKKQQLKVEGTFEQQVTAKLNELNQLAEVLGKLLQRRTQQNK